VIKSSSPFFIKPITNAITDRINTFFLKPNFETHYKFLESQLETSPDGGKYLTGKDLTAADILMVFPLEAGGSRTGMAEEAYPRLNAYVKLLHDSDGYKRAVQKIVEVEGEYNSNL
jgi:glutathione S-transferase